MLKFCEENFCQSKSTKQLRPDTRWENMPRFEEQMCCGAPVRGDGGDRQVGAPAGSCSANTRVGPGQTGRILAHLIQPRRQTGFCTALNFFFFSPIS